MAARFGLTEKQFSNEWEAYSFSNKRVPPSLLHLEKLEVQLQDKQNKCGTRGKQTPAKGVGRRTPVAQVQIH